MDDKGFIFTTDLLLAMIIVTMAIGLTTSTFESLNYQIQDFSGRQSLERTANDAADYLVKMPGNPSNWERNPQSNSLPGLAAIDRGLPDSNFLHNRKVSKLKQNPNLLANLVHTSNFNLNITKADTGQSIISMGSNVPSTAKEVAVANRTAIFMPGEVLFQMINLTHINPGHPSQENGHLWYSKAGNPPIYVGPGNVTTIADPDSSFEVTAADLDIYDYFIIINENTGVRSADYGYTDGDAVVNGTYGPYDDKSRQDAIDGELRQIYGGGGWQNLRPLGTGSSIQVNGALQAVLDHGGGPDMKMWIRSQSDPKDNFDISLIKVFKNESLNRIPVKVVLKIWD